MESEQTQYQLVTIEEMRELAKDEVYKNPDTEEEFPLELLKDEKTGKLYTDYFLNPYLSELIQNHIFAELCMSEFDKVDWARVTNGYDNGILAHIIGLYENPLVWCAIPEELMERYVIVGKIAKEEQVERPNQMDIICFLLNDSREQRALWFVDHMPKKGIPRWEIFLSNYRRADLLKVMSPDYDSIDMPPIRIEAFIENIEYVYANRGPEKVKEVLDRLRTNWDHLVKLRMCGFEQLSQEQMKEFREQVFDTINYQIDVWEMEKEEEPEEELEEPKVCRYIDLDKLAEVGIHTPEEFTRNLCQACEQDAPTLSAFLKKNFKLGYLDFHGDGKKKIYEHLKECFPQGLKYSYTNFTLYFD